MIGITRTLIAVLAVLSARCLAEVIQLDTKNFEHLTQASTGSTTGDWLIKFYAPWCGHCRKMEPAYEEVAQMLEGDVNVARVDVPANRELGTRFDIKGFPTLKFFSKGKVYEYKGRRTAEDIVEFARGGYQIQEPEDIQPPLGIFGEVGVVFRHAYKQAAKDLKSGNYFTVDVFLCFMPVFFVAFMILVMCLPVPGHPDPSVYKQHERDLRARAQQLQQNPDAAPATSEADVPSKKDD